MKAGALQPQWLTIDAPMPPGVRVLSSLRAGGASQAPYASLNLGGHVGDEPAAVAANRAALEAAAQLPSPPAWLDQRHGVNVVDLDLPGPYVADAAFTRTPGRVCAILTADCLPVVLATESGDVVAAAHAGWRGLEAGVLEAAVLATAQAAGASAQHLVAWMGPAIGPLHFEVGPEVREVLLAADPQAGTAFTANARGRFMADLYLLARRRLTALGLTRIYGGGECTFTHAQRYFSHRRDGVTGRQATLVWRAG